MPKGAFLILNKDLSLKQVIFIVPSFSGLVSLLSLSLLIESISILISCVLSKLPINPLKSSSKSYIFSN